jgi:hypothetical protein
MDLRDGMLADPVPGRSPIEPSYNPLQAEIVILIAVTRGRRIAACDSYGNGG